MIVAHGVVGRTVRRSVGKRKKGSWTKAQRERRNVTSRWLRKRLFVFATMLGSIGAGRLAAGLVELAVDGPARLVWLTST